LALLCDDQQGFRWTRASKISIRIPEVMLDRPTRPLRRLAAL